MEASSRHNLSIGEAHNTLRLTTTLLNGSNYTSWAKSASLSLQSRGKLIHITGQITTKPAQHSGTAEPVPEGEISTTNTTIPVPIPYTSTGTKMTLLSSTGFSTQWNHRYLAYLCIVTLPRNFGMKQKKCSVKTKTLPTSST
jgi:gag-polypeptide of LTR copia-type